MLYLTGDTHGDMLYLETYSDWFKMTKDDVFCILGDVGINYHMNSEDVVKKHDLARCDTVFLCIQGNHEKRPNDMPQYHLEDWNGGKVWVEKQYPNILFARDGDIYQIGSKSVLVLGGAYSVDKWYRLQHGYQWFPDEQMSEEDKARAIENLDKCGWKVDIVLSHTCPYSYEPTDMFLPQVDQSTVDSSMEHWLNEIERKLDYGAWYCGHWHTERKVEKIRFMYHDLEEIDV